MEQLDFGKHKGKHVDQIGDEYLQWMQKSFSVSSQWQKVAADTLALRGKAKAPPALLSDLKSCTLRRDLHWGRRIHAVAVECGNCSNLYVTTALIKMYAKCGSMEDARQVFDTIPKPNVVSWTALILGYAENGEGQASLELFSKMKADGCAPDSVTYMAALKACTALAVNGDDSERRRAMKLGSKIHVEIGHNLNPSVQSTLIDMYGKCDSMADARQVFDSIQNPDVVSWNALLLGYAENGEGDATLEMFSKMKADGCLPNSVTYVAALKACICLAISEDGRGKAQGLQTGRGIHLEIGDSSALYVQNTLIDMYAKCGSMDDARQIFSRMQKPDIVSWNALLFGHTENGEAQVSLELFLKMKADGYTPSSVTYVGALKACTCLAMKGQEARALETGRGIHLMVAHRLNPHLQSTLIDMYAKCGCMLDARRVFDSIRNPNVICWTALLSGYAENGEAHVSLELFSKMKADGCTLHYVTYIAVLKACRSLAVDGDVAGKAEVLQIGREIHWEIGDRLNLHVQNMLMDMYAKCGSMLDAYQVFEGISKPNLVSWSSLISGYAENGEGHVALELFHRMKSDGFTPDSVTYMAVLKACALTGALALGRKLHSDISEFTVPVVTCLVDFYAKCGSMVEARAVFDFHAKARDVTTWTVLLAGYSSFGDTGSVFNVFKGMQDTGFRPDGVTFVYVLLCCSHAGLIRKAREYLEAMPVLYGIAPAVLHHSCLIDGLARANQLAEAVSLLRKMPCSPSKVTWSSLLGACRKWKNVELGRIAFQALADMDIKGDAFPYLLMSHICTRPHQVSRGQVCIADETGKLVKFVAGKEDPPEFKNLSAAQFLEQIAVER